MSKGYIKVEYRDIAKMLASALPVEGQDYGDKVNEYLAVIKAMPTEAKIALKSAYVFSHKVPREEREDLFQDLTLAVLKAKATDERLAYAIARCDWLNWWSKYKIRQHYSLDSVVEDTDGNQASFGELLVGEVDFEARLNGDLDGEKLYSQLPSWVKVIVDKRLMGKSITGGERRILDKWVIARPLILASYVN
jgi:hypothetical protein